ncbi:MAG: PKD domain-containing protein [Acidobacteria bacterium]|nr:PKD domain-containing protein [Acidobacteriota bacterium]
MKRFFSNKRSLFNLIFVAGVTAVLGALALATVPGGGFGVFSTAALERPAASAPADDNFDGAFPPGLPNGVKKLLAKKSAANERQNRFGFFRNYYETDPALILSAGGSADERRAGQFEDYEKESPKEEDGPALALERDILMMKDPALGFVPSERLLTAKNYKDRLMKRPFAALGGVNWKEQGPNNVGGRTRALMVDPNDPSGNTLFAGSVGGGLWKTTNINSATPNWAPVNDLLGNLAVTSIAYDPSNTQVMYFTTGEGYFNIDAIRGLGVFKSTDGGATWTQLASTNNVAFNYCQKVVVNSTGVVFVATSTNGVQRSFDGGTTWTKKLGTGLGITGAVSNFAYDVEVAANGDVYGTLNGSIHKSTNAGVSFGAAQTLPISAGRIELAVAPSDANYAYALVELSNTLNGVLRTTNGGTTWTARTEPADADPGIPAADAANGQAWYDLSIAVDPNNRDRLFMGGIDLFGSTDGGGTWTQVTHWYGGFSLQYVHADQHHVVFQPGSSNIAYFSNDGGVFRTVNASAAVPTIEDRNANYRTAQFYSAAMHPTAQTPYYLAGAQDNGTHRFSTTGPQATIEVTGGDGAFTHIDQDQPQFQWTQYIYNDYYRSINGGASWTNVTANSNGSFINPTDFDDVNNRMYAANTTNTYLRWDDPQTGGTFLSISVAAFNGQVSAVKVSPNTANRVFFGTETGRVVRVDNAHTGGPTATNISTGLPANYVSSVEVETGNDNHLLATFSNYGVNSVWESTDGGTSWTSVEGNLPDMPIRWALFNPSNADQAILATELGVWSTDNLNGGATVWGASNSGLANVRVDMLQVRQSDKYVIAATHGRGLYASDLFTTPTAIFSSDIQLTYIGQPVTFKSDSYQATSWSWNFGDGSPAATTENPAHTYTTAGKYNVTLTINSGADALTKNQFIQVLPNRGTPYVVASSGATFETDVDDFGSQAISGGINKWERGVPTNFLTTVNSPVNVWKTDLDADLTVGDYVSVLQTPSYNFSNTSSAYTLRFRRSMEIAFCNGPFAVQLQYSTDKGQTWTRLGVNADPASTNWYNRGPATGCPVDAGIFADRYGWTITSNNTLATYNITTGAPALVGQPSVTFRFVLSVASGYSASGYAVDGFMIDDFEILGPVNPAINPTAAGVAVGGRVTTANGTGIRNVSVMITGGGLTEPRYARTGSFGNYSFGDLPAGETYVVSVVSKKYSFPTPSRVISVQDNVADADFTAAEQ